MRQDMRKKEEKGSRGYLLKKKRQGVFYTLLCLLIGVAIYFTGYFLNKKSNANIFTILAMLMVLPGAKMLTNVIVLFPFHTVSEEREQKMRTVIPEGSRLLTGVVFTSPEKIMNLDFLWLGDGYVYGCLGREEQDMAYIQAYLSKGVHNYGEHYQIKIWKDAGALGKAVAAAVPKECSGEERELVEEYVLSLII